VGTGVRKELNFDNTLLYAIPDATKIIRENWFEGTAPPLFVLVAQYCKACMDTLNEDVMVRKKLPYLHDILLHHQVDDKISYTSQN
jgi:hypothetical protein